LIDGIQVLLRVLPAGEVVLLQHIAPHVDAGSLPVRLQVSALGAKRRPKDIDAGFEKTWRKTRRRDIVRRTPRVDLVHRLWTAGDLTRVIAHVDELKSAVRRDYDFRPVVADPDAVERSVEPVDS